MAERTAISWTLRKKKAGGGEEHDAGGGRFRLPDLGRDPGGGLQKPSPGPFGQGYFLVQ